jgi:thaumarchaeosortase
MDNVLLNLKKHSDALMKIVPLVAFVVPCLWLYILYPDTFQLLWKGRTFELFFVWLISLELILGWEKIQTLKIQKPVSNKSIIFMMTLLLPTVYVAVSNYMGLNGFISGISKQAGIQWFDSMPLSTEYFVFAACFCLTIYLSSGFKGIKDFSVPAVFMGVIGFLYTVDNVFPYGQFTPLQFFVPATTVFAAGILGLIGFNTTMVTKYDISYGNLPFLTSVDPLHPARTATFAIAWPCAGIESFLIFGVVALLFLKRMPISWRAKIGYFAIGAGVTYVINILRIVTIFTIGMNYGENSSQVQQFHFYYGPLYSVAWIVSYPMIIIGSRSLWNRIKNRDTPSSGIIANGVPAQKF